MSIARDETYGLIFAGGTSSRMGRSKAHLVIHGQPQYAYLLEIFRELGMNVFISCRPDQLQEFPEDTPCITDLYAGVGPLAGLLSAFEHSAQINWFCVACDMPLLDAKLIDELLVNSDTRHLASCMLSPTDNKPEPFCSLWRPAARPLIRKAFMHGQYSLRELLSSGDVQHIESRQSEKLANANTQEDLDRLLNE